MRQPEAGSVTPSGPAAGAAGPVPAAPAPTIAPAAALEALPVASLKGVGERQRERLERLGIATVADLLFHLPHRYEDRTRVHPLGGLRPGDRVLVEGTVDLTQTGQGRRRALLCRISDGTGALTLRFFRYHPNQVKALSRGTRLRCYGEVRPGLATLEMVHPEYQTVGARGAAAPEPALTPVYPTTEGLTQTALRNLTDRALALLSAERTAALTDWLPASRVEAWGLPTLHDALRTVHRPPPTAPLELLEAGRHPAQRRLALEELAAHHLSQRRIRAAIRQHAAPAVGEPGVQAARLRAALPFALTAAQERVVAEIARDLRQPLPMLRLVQGDVGSGKTVVAALAALQVIESGHQVAVMAPTELLAEQHFEQFRQWLEPLGCAPALLSGRAKGKARRELLARVESGEAPLVVGTHALFQDAVRFARLGLVVVDEQHRFGVHQRLALREKGADDGVCPHQLVLTATPIPRTLAMAMYADLDTSVIDERPPGRTPVRTVVVPDLRRDEVIERIRRACGEGRQAYWVCPLIETSEHLQCQAAMDTAEVLREALPDLVVGLVHGRMKGEEKAAVMAAFKDNDVDLLVATTVIEVGVDVPNASLMVIENAERLGLAQLHQLRGRIGRGDTDSVCVLMYHGDLTDVARERLAVLRETTDGFEVAQRDLELRGPGEILGTRQTGLARLRVADLARDQDLLPRVAELTETLSAHCPEAVDPLVARWVGAGEQYRDV